MKIIPFPRSTAWRIFISFSLLMGSVTVFTGVVMYHFSQSMITEAASNQLRVLSISISEQIKKHLWSLEGTIKTIQNSKKILQAFENLPVSKPSLQNKLKQFQLRNHGFSAFAIFNTKGICIVASDESWEGIEAAKEPFFTNGMKELHFGDIYDSPTEGKIQLVSAPLAKGIQRLGVLVGQVRMSVIYDLMDQKLGLGDDADAFLLDRNLRFITPGKSGPEDLQLSHLIDTPLKHHLNEEFWVGLYDNYSGKEVLGTVHKIPGYFWLLTIEQDYKSILRQAGHVSNTIVISTLALFLGLVLITYLISRSITQPIQILVNRAQSISQGDFSQPMTLTRGSYELMFLAKEFDEMRAKIAASQGKLLERLEESEQRRIDNERLAAIGTMAATLAHEIRNPLNAMSLLLSQLELKAGKSDESILQVVTNLRDQIARLDRMVSEILDYTKPVQLQKAAVNLRGFLKDLYALYEAICAEKHIVFQILYPEDQLYILVDRDKLQQCFINLLQNSIDALHSTTDKRIVVEVVSASEKVRVVVTDNGSGINPSISRRLFDLFYTTKERGTGLGLNTVKKIIEAHGGNVMIEPGPENGTIVSVDLPLIAS